MLKQRFPNALFIDLLNSDIAAQYTVHPSSFRQQILAGNHPIVIVDEVQTSYRKRKFHKKTDDGIRIIPWREFCAELWQGRLF